MKVSFEPKTVLYAQAKLDCRISDEDIKMLLFRIVYVEFQEMR